MPLPVLQPLLSEGASTLYSKIKIQKGVWASPGAWENPHPGPDHPAAISYHHHTCLWVSYLHLCPAWKMDGDSFWGDVGVVSEEAMGTLGGALGRNWPWEVEPAG